MRADRMLEQGELDGQAVWIMIMKAVDELINQQPSPVGRRMPMTGIDHKRLWAPHRWWVRSQ